MKKLIAAIFLIGLIFPACKKKKTDDTPAEVKQVTVPDEYELQFISTFDLKKNASGFDTVLMLSKSIEKHSSVKNFEYINATVKCDNLEVYDEDPGVISDGTVSYTSLPNFQHMLSPATWSVVCNETGDFTYSDSALLPSFPNAHNIAIDTIRKYEDLAIDITGAVNYDGAYLQVVKGLAYDEYNQGWDGGAGATTLTIDKNTYDFNTFYNIHHVLLRIVFYKNTTVTINGKQVIFTKQAIYNYNCILK